MMPLRQFIFAEPRCWHSGGRDGLIMSLRDDGNIQKLPASHSDCVWFELGELLYQLRAVQRRGKDEQGAVAAMHRPQGGRLSWACGRRLFALCLPKGKHTAREDSHHPNA